MAPGALLWGIVAGGSFQWHSQRFGPVKTLSLARNAAKNQCFRHLPANEKVLAESRTFDDSVYFVSFEPRAHSDDPCQAGLSVNRLYRVSIVNGDPVVDLDELDPNDPDEINAARHMELDQGGIAVRPIFFFPSPLDAENCTGTECAPSPIGCVGVECFDPDYRPNPVRTLWTQNGVD